MFHSKGVTKAIVFSSAFCLEYLQGCFVSVTRQGINNPQNSQNAMTKMSEVFETDQKYSDLFDLICFKSEY